MADIWIEIMKSGVMMPSQVAVGRGLHTDWNNLVGFFDTFICNVHENE